MSEPPVKLGPGGSYAQPWPPQTLHQQRENDRLRAVRDSLREIDQRLAATAADLFTASGRVSPELQDARQSVERVIQSAAAMAARAAERTSARTDGTP